MDGSSHSLLGAHVVCLESVRDVIMLAEAMPVLVESVAASNKNQQGRERKKYMAELGCVFFRWRIRLVSAERCVALSVAKGMPPARGVGGAVDP